MGLAKIVENVGEGLYRVQPEYDWTKLEAELEALDAQDAAATEQRLPIQQAVIEVLDLIYDLEAELSVAIREYKIKKMQDDDDDESQPNKDNNALPVSSMIDLSGYGIEQVTMPELPKISPVILNIIKKLGVARRELAAREKVLADLEMGFVTRQVRRNTLNSARESFDAKVIEAWCVDYSTEMTDQKVRTIEVPGFRHKDGVSMAVAPGGTGTAGMEYGQLRLALTMSPEQVALNLALEPGHLKWRPRWRYGQITWISESEDVCHVALEQEWGRRVDVAPKMPLNEKSTLENVPIRYMTCNRAAFEVGDQVVVEWSGDQPAVIGFRREPKECIPVIQFPPHVALKAKTGGVDDFLYILAVGEMEVSGSGVITYTFSSNSCDIGQRYAAIVRKGGGVKGEWIFFETEFSLSVDVDAEIQLFPNNFNSNAERIILDTASHESLDEYTASNDYFIASPVAYYYPGTQIVQYYVWRWSRQTQNITLTKAPCSSNQNIIKWNINGFRTAFTHASENMDEFWEQMNNIPDSITVTHNQSGRNLTYQKGFVDGDHLYYIRPES